MTEPVNQGEFNRAIQGISKQISDVAGTTQEGLAEGKKTNGRVYALELNHAVMTVKLDATKTDFDRRLTEASEETVRLVAAAETRTKDLSNQIETSAATLHQQMIDNPPLTRRDLVFVIAVVSGTVTALVGFAAALVKWLPALLAAGSVSP